MKNPLAILCILFYGLQAHAQTDTTNHAIYVPIKEGPYKENYESGKLKVEGYYKLVDSIECINCYDVTWGKLKTKIDSGFMRTGIWKEYYEDGTLKATGGYKGIHIINTITFAKPDPHPVMGRGVFQPGDYREEYLKDDYWQYYNPKGEFIKEEFYYRGMLTNQAIFER